MIQRSSAQAHFTAAVFLAIYLLPITVVAQAAQPSLANMPGSMLIYPFYTSHSANRQLQETRFVLTNTGLGYVSVRLFFISGLLDLVPPDLAQNRTYHNIFVSVEPGWGNATAS